MLLLVLLLHDATHGLRGYHLFVVEDHSTESILLKSSVKKNSITKNVNTQHLDSDGNPNDMATDHDNADGTTKTTREQQQPEQRLEVCDLEKRKN